MILLRRRVRRGYIVFDARAVIAQILETSEEFPPSQCAPSLTIDQAMEKVRQNLGGDRRA